VAELVDAPSPEKRKPTVYTADQVNILLNSIEDPKIKLALTLAIFGGFREGEILGIHIEDVRPDGSITVNHAVQYQIGKGVVITQPKTDKSRRSVKLPPSCFNALKDYLGQLNRNQGLLFTTSSGKPINPRFLIKKFKEATEAAGLPEIRFHDLRGTSATLLLSAKIHPKIVQERLGHSSITLTMDTYSSVLPTMQDEAAEALEKLFGTPGGTP
jgi:integrase